VFAATLVIRRTRRIIFTAARVARRPLFSVCQQAPAASARRVSAGATICVRRLSVPRERKRGVPSRQRACSPLPLDSGAACRAAKAGLSSNVASARLRDIVFRQSASALPLELAEPVQSSTAFVPESKDAPRCLEDPADAHPTVSVRAPAPSVRAGFCVRRCSLFVPGENPDNQMPMDTFSHSPIPSRTPRLPSSEASMCSGLGDRVPSVLLIPRL